MLKSIDIIIIIISQINIFTIISSGYVLFFIIIVHDIIGKQVKILYGLAAVCEEFYLKM